MKVRIVLLCLLTSLCFLSLLSLLSPAHAQGYGGYGGGGGGGGGVPGSGGPGYGGPHWVITSECKGSRTATVPDPNNPTQQTTIKEPIVMTSGSYMSGEGGDTVGNFPTGKATYDNKIHFHVRWVGNDGKIAPNAPKKVFLQKIAGVCWGGGFWHDGGSVTGTNDDGLGDPDKLTAPYNSNSTGVHVVQKNGSSGNIDITFTQCSEVDAADGAIATLPQLPWCQGYMSWYCGVSFTDRNVTISREGAHNEWTDDDGNTHGDTIRSYTANHDTMYGITLSGIIKNWQQFDAALSGSWNMKAVTTGHGSSQYVPDVAYTWQPQYSGATMFWNQWLQDMGQQIYDIDSFKGSTGSPTPDTMTYTVTDNQDGITATAVYYLKRHDVYEETSHQTEAAYANERQAGSPAVYNRGDKPIEVPGGYVEESGSHTIGVSVQPDALVGGWELKTLGLSIGYSYTYTVNSGQNAAPITLPPGTYTYAKLRDTYTRHWGTADQWDAGGFTGATSFDFMVPRPPGYEIYMAGPYPTGSGEPGGGGLGH